MNWLVLFEREDGGRGIIAVDNNGDITADEEDEDDEERISRSWDENGVVLQESEESEESNKDGEGEVSSDSEIIIYTNKLVLKVVFSKYWLTYLVRFLVYEP